jgi:hemoglobin
MARDGVPTLFEWAGGMPVLERLTDAFYARVRSHELRTADDIGLPSDPEFRSALVAYLEWGSRVAVINSQDGAAVDPSAPMPKWGWGVPGGPYPA